MKVEASIGLCIMTEKGLSVLNTIVDSGFSSLILWVVVGKDSHVENDYSAEIVETCSKNKIYWKFRDKEPTLNVNYIFAVSWKWMLPDHPGLIVFHDSPLPKYRGFLPLVSQLIQGEESIGVTALFGTKDYDEGLIIAIERCPICYPITIQEAITISLGLYSKLCEKILADIVNGRALHGVKQDESEATYSLWRDDQDYFIDWTKSSNFIQRFIYATGYPYLGARTRLNGNEIVISEAYVWPNDVLITNRDVGKIIFIRENKPIVVCGKGLLCVLDGYYMENKLSIFPLDKFRSRFT